MTERNSLPIDETLSAMKAGQIKLGRSAQVGRLPGSIFVITPTDARVRDHIAKTFKAGHRNAKIQHMGFSIIAKSKADAIRVLKRVADLHAHATK